MTGPRIAVLGPPGAGKTTLATGLSEKLSAPYIAIGERLRAVAASDRQVAALIYAGRFVPDEIAWDLVARDIHEGCAYAGFVLDGFPRTMGQVAKLEEADGNRSCPGRVIYLDVDEDVAVERISSRRIGADVRADDQSADAIRNRIELYRESTLEVISAYRRRGILSHLDGNLQTDEVLAAAMDAVRVRN